MFLKNHNRNNNLLTGLSALLVFVAVLQVNFMLAWFCFVPLFAALQNAGTKPVKTGIYFGVVLSLLSFSWMIPGAQRFTGESVGYGLIVFFVSTLVLTAYWVLLFAVFRLLQQTPARMVHVFLNALVAASVWVLGEALLAQLSMRMPWFLFRSGMAVSGSLYAIQPVAWLGVSIASFVVVAVNYMLAYVLVAKACRALYLPLSLFAIYMLAGYGMYVHAAGQPARLPSIKAAVLTENIAPEMRWDEHNGNLLVNRLLQLARAAAQLHPDIAIWTESTVPWTYRADDDFVNEILRITKAQQVTHILGINSDGGTASVYNSVYAIQPDGSVSDRYHKRYLLGFIEQPVAGVIFPFLSSGGYEALPGSRKKPLNTKYGKAGILICNESTVSSAAADLVHNGAQFILNLSNDGWFSDTYIADQHFYNARLRAVETRKDVVVNSNDGITGLIKASGEIEGAQRSEEPMVNLAEIVPNNFVPLAVSSPYLMLYVSALLVLAAVWVKVKRAVRRN